MIMIIKFQTIENIVENKTQLSTNFKRKTKAETVDVKTLQNAKADRLISGIEQEIRANRLICTKEIGT